jgi:hypothetical protein
MSESDEIGSRKLITYKYFFSSEDKKIHKYPVEDEPAHVEYRDENIYDGESGLTYLINTEKNGGSAESCPVCFKGEVIE